ncbi:hypothetical protein HDU76_000231 [Blyttiomyces sp. JEL0837]|nr:hypothetical protein HDU76_000231 [Blyttiomyces sp. JEL0837]
MTVMGGRYRPSKYKVVCRRLSSGVWKGGTESDKIYVSKFVSTFMPRIINHFAAMDEFLTLNALLPSLRTFGTIDLCQNPHDLVVSRQLEQTIPQRCSLQRIKALRVLVNVLNETSFAALIEAMVHSFTGVKRLIIDYFEIKKQLDFDGFKLQLRRANTSTSLLEIVFLFGSSKSMLDFEKGCEDFMGGDCRLLLKCILTGHDIRYLLDPGANDNCAIKIAAQYGYVDLVRKLLGMRGGFASGEDNYVIQMAAENGHVDVVSVLLEDDFVDATANGSYAIIAAAKNGNVEIVDLLLTKGAFGGDDIRYAIHQAQVRGHDDVVALLDTAGGRFEK